MCAGDRYNILILPSSGRYFEVPYGCCVPPRVNNLLVAGRAVAGDRTRSALIGQLTHNTGLSLVTILNTDLLLVAATPR